MSPPAPRPAGARPQEAPTGEGPQEAPTGEGLRATEAVQARIWEALRHVEDPELPVSVLGLGLIVSVAYQPAGRRAQLQITFTAMGCPAMDFIQEDIRDALLADPEIDEVAIEVVWDPVWSRQRIRSEARETMRRLGVLV
jgi:metal-sulfur cluster biosynthetic enzyme